MPILFRRSNLITSIIVIFSVEISWHLNGNRKLRDVEKIVHKPWIIAEEDQLEHPFVDVWRGRLNFNHITIA